MTSAVANRPANAVLSPCGRCGDLVFSARTPHGPVVLDPDLVPGGLYELGEHFTATRRSLVLMFNEARGRGRVVGGYDPHECMRDTAFLR